jgi:hypothetical protein
MQSVKMLRSPQREFHRLEQGVLQVQVVKKDISWVIAVGLQAEEV